MSRDSYTRRTKSSNSRVLTNLANSTELSQDHHHQATYPFWNNESLPFMVLALSSEEARLKSVFSINFRRCRWRCLLDRWSCRSNRSPRVYRDLSLFLSFFFVLPREGERERERREKEREREREKENISNEATSFLVARAVAPSRETLRDRAEKQQERATERRATLSSLDSPSSSARYRAIRNSRRRLAVAVSYQWPIFFLFFFWNAILNFIFLISVDLPIFNENQT